MKAYDVIIIGAGSVGVPTAMALGSKGLKILVLDRHPSPGQGENKRAVGGVRATHSDPAKILIGLRSVEIFSTWKEIYGDEIEWDDGGYVFPVYETKDKQLLVDLSRLQKKYGLNIDFVDAGQIREIIPGINPDGLLGGAYSPGDGAASPLMAIHAFHRKACEAGVTFRFNADVQKIWQSKGVVKGVILESEKYVAPVLIDAAGAFSREICKTVDVDIPVVPESHEAGITESVKRFFKSMVIDMRPGRGSKNCYIYQNRLGQIMFSLTPDPPFVGTDIRETWEFMSQISERMVNLIPRLRSIRIRRVWRGLYPMSPDGHPLVGWNREVEGLLHVTGMCGQGFMLGPGIGEMAARMVVGGTTPQDETVISAFSPYREFKSAEILK